MRVTVDLFSGRDNPAWSLTPDESERLLLMIGEIVRGEPFDSGPRHAALGFRGIVVEAEPHDGAAITSLEASAGAVCVDVDGETIVRRDAGSAIRDWLLDTGRPHLPADVWRLVDEAVRRD